MADFKYSAKIDVDPNEIRKSVEAGLNKVAFSVSDKSHAAAIADIQNHVKPRLTFSTNKASLKSLRNEITSNIGSVGVKLTLDRTRFAQEVRALANQKVTVDVSVNDSRNAFRNLGNVTTQIAEQFDKVGQAKDRFAANVEQKFPRIIERVRSLNEELGKTSGLLSTIKVPKAPNIERKKAEAQQAAVAGVPAGTAEKSGNAVKQTGALAEKKGTLTNQIRKANEELQRYNDILKGSIAQTNTFAERVGFTTGRLAAYLLPATSIFQLTRGLGVARDQIVEINRSITQLTQIMKGDAQAAARVSDQVFDISQHLGQSATEVLNITKFLAQAGETFSGETGMVRAVEALAATNLGATFGNIEETAQGALAYVNQFNKSADDMVHVLDVANTLSRDFAVEAGDLFEAVRTGGAAFATFGGSIEEFQSVVTTLRQLTRLPTSTIGAGLNTIVLSVFSPENLNFIRQLGVAVDDSEGRMRSFVDILTDVGSLFNTLSQEQKGVVAVQLFDVRQSKIGIRLLEDLGKSGERVGSKQASVFRQAMESSTDSAGSLFRDANLGLTRIDAQLQSVGAAFQKAFGTISQDEAFLRFIRDVAGGLKLIAVSLEAIAPILPSLLRIGTARIAGAAFNAAPRFGRGFQNAASGKTPELDGVSAFASANVNPSRILLPADRQAQQSMDNSIKAEQENTRTLQTLISTLERLIATANGAPLAAKGMQPSAVAGGPRNYGDLLQSRLNRQTNAIAAIDRRLGEAVVGRNGRPASRATQQRVEAERAGLERRRSELVRARDETEKRLRSSSRQSLQTPLPDRNNPSVNIEMLQQGRADARRESQAVSRSIERLNSTTRQFRNAVELVDQNLLKNPNVQARAVGLNTLRQTMDIGRLALANRMGLDQDRDKLMGFALPHERTRAIAAENAARGRNLNTEELRKFATPQEVRQAAAGAERTQRRNYGHKYDQSFIEAAKSYDLVKVTNRDLAENNRRLRTRQESLFKEDQRFGGDIAAQQRERLNTYADQGFLGPQPVDPNRRSLRERAGARARGLGRSAIRGGRAVGRYGLGMAPYLGAFGVDAVANSYIPNIPITNIQDATTENIRDNRRFSALRGGVTGAATGLAFGASFGPVGMGVGAAVGGIAGAFLAYRSAVEETRSSLLSAASAAKDMSGAIRGIVRVSEDVGSGVELRNVIRSNDPSAGALRERLRSLTGEIGTNLARNNRNLNTFQVTDAFRQILRRNITTEVKRERTDLTVDQQAAEVDKIFNNIFSEILKGGHKAYQAAVNQERLTQSLEEFSTTLQDTLRSIQDTRDNAVNAVATNRVAIQQRDNNLSVLQGRGGASPIVSDDFADIIATRFKTAVERGSLTTGNSDAITLGFLSQSERRDAVMISQLSKMSDDLFRGFVSDVNKAENVEAAAPGLSGRFLARITSAFASENFGVNSMSELTSSQREMVERFETLLRRQVQSTNIGTFRDQDPRKLTEGLFGQAGDVLSPTVETLRARIILTTQAIEENQRAYEVQRQVIQDFSEAAQRATNNVFAKAGRLRNIGVDEERLTDSIRSVRQGIGRVDLPGSTTELGRSQAEFERATAPLTEILRASGQNSSVNQIQEGVQSALRNGLTNLNSSQASKLAEITGNSDARNLAKVLAFQEQREPGDTALNDIALKGLLRQTSPTLRGAIDANRAPTEEEFKNGLRESTGELSRMAQSSARFMSIQNSAAQAYNNLQRSQDNYDRQVRNAERTLQALSEEFSNAQNILNRSLQTNAQLGRASTSDITGAQIGLSQARGFGVFGRLGGINDLPDLANAPREQVVGAARAFAGIPDAIAQRITQSLQLLGNRRVQGNLTGTNAAEIFEQLRGAARFGDVGKNVDEVRNGFGQLFDINNQMASIEDMQVNALFDIARNTSIMAERMLNMKPGELMGGALQQITRLPGSTNTPITSGPPERIAVSRFGSENGSAQEVGRLNNQLAALPALISALETASRANGAHTEQFIRGLQNYVEELRTSGGKASNVSVDANLSVTGFEGVGKDVAVRAIITSLMQNFLAQLGDTPGEMQLRDKLNLALRQMQTGTRDGK